MLKKKMLIFLYKYWKDIAPCNSPSFCLDLLHLFMTDKAPHSKDFRNITASGVAVRDIVSKNILHET